MKTIDKYLTESDLKLDQIMKAIVISLNRDLKSQLPKFQKAEAHSNGFTVKQAGQSVKFFIK